jgi:hypothetical protein
VSNLLYKRVKEREGKTAKSGCFASHPAHPTEVILLSISFYRGETPVGREGGKKYVN